MKPGRWLVSLLVLVIVALIFMRSKKEETATTAPLSPSDTTGAEKSSAISTNATQAETVGLASTPSETLPLKTSDPLENANHLQVIVQNETGQPLEGASVQTSFRGEQRRPALTNLNRTFTTSSRGIADVLWPVQKFEQFELLVSKDNFASRKMVWDLKTGDDIPANFIVRLKASVHVGGFVVDPEGNPVADATVRLSRFWSGGENIQRKGEEPAFPIQNQITGTDGRWTARNLPSDLLDRIGIEASHTNFIGVRVTMDRKPEIEQELREGKYKLQLTRGLEVRGRVINEQQQPITNAQVWAGRKFRRERQETRSDAQGRFVFRNVNEGKVDFSTMAEGYAPDAKSHNVTSNGTEEIVFQLAKGSVIRGTVQDESSQPIEGVRVVLEGSPGDPAYDFYAFSTTTDSEGKFEWKSAPNLVMPFYIGKQGYEQKRNLRLKPAEDNVITLRRSRQVVGQVLNSETDQPITNFTVTVGRYISVDRFFSGSSSDTKEFKNDQGSFTYDLSENEHSAIRVAATDYSEKAQTLPPAENGQIKVVIKLKPAKSLNGMVVTEDGQPVSGASVAVAEPDIPGRNIQFVAGRLRSSGDRSVLVTTDANGHFFIPSPPESGNVVAANGSAFGSASIAEVQASGVLTIRGFGRIQGMLIRGGGGVAGQELLLTSPGNGVSYNFESSHGITDAEGHFAFEKVPAGTNAIVRLVRTSSSTRSHSHRSEVVVVAGQTTPVVLGGADATVQAQVRFETAPTETDYIMSARLSTVRPPIPPELTPEQRREFLKSPEWKQQMQNMKNYSASVGSDGSIVVDSVVPGEYTLTVTVVKSDDTSIVNRAPLAQGETKVIIPAGADPATPLQVGEVLLKRPPRP